VCSRVSLDSLETRKRLPLLEIEPRFEGFPARVQLITATELPRLQGISISLFVSKHCLKGCYWCRYYWCIFYGNKVLDNSLDSVVGVVTGLWVVRPRNRGSIPSSCVHTVKEAQSFPYLMRNIGSSTKIKQPKHEADHSPSSSGA